MGCNSGKIALAEFNDLADERKSFHHRYKLGNCIGAGAQGSVFLARRVDSNDEFAVKVLHILGYGSQANSSVRRKQAFTNERIAWAQVGGHPNICSLQEWFIDNHFGYFVMEHCPSSLFSAWKGEPYLNEHTYANYFKDMASALAHIHSVGVVHKDVKHANFLLGGPSGRTTMLCDFGLSTLLSDHNAMMTKERGTPPYMAPEMVKRNAPCGTACDLWSFGVIAYVAFFGEWPYCAEEITPEAVKEAIRLGDTPPLFSPPARFPQGCASDAALDFVQALLKRNPKQRPTASDALKMDYLLNKDIRALQLQTDDLEKISLSPMLDGAIECGAFSISEPRADPYCALALRKQQSIARRRYASRRRAFSRGGGMVDHSLAKPPVHCDEGVATHPFAAP